jgi:hypothetical protein
MKKKAQLEMNPIAILMGIAGLVLGWILAGRMEAGIVIQIISAGMAGVVGFFIANTVANN